MLENEAKWPLFFGPTLPLIASTFATRQVGQMDNLKPFGDSIRLRLLNVEVVKNTFHR